MTVTRGAFYKVSMLPPDRTLGKFITSFSIVWRDQMSLRSRRKKKNVKVQRKRKFMKKVQTKMREMERYTIQLLPKGLQKGWTGEEMAIHQ